MPEVQTAVPGQKLARRYGIKAQVISPSLEPVIVPVVLMDDLTDEGPGPRFAFASDRFSGAGGLLTQTALVNRLGADVLLRDVELVFAVASATRWEVVRSGPALSSTSTEFWSDTRIGGSPSALVTFGNDIGATADRVYTGRALADTLIRLPFPNYIMNESAKLHFLTISIDITAAFTWLWSEESLSPEEAF